MKALAKQRSYLLVIVCQVSQEFIAGTILLAKGHDNSSNLIRVGVQN
jgi:hypothetical protein